MDWQTVATILGVSTAPLMIMSMFIWRSLSSRIVKVEDKVDGNGRAISRLEGYIAGTKHSHAEQVKKSRANA